MLRLAHGLLAQDAIEFTIVGRHLGQRLVIAAFDELTDAAGIVHRLVLQRGKTIVEHGIADVQGGLFLKGPSHLVVGKLQAVLLFLLATRSLAQRDNDLPHHDGKNHEEEQHQKDDGHLLVGLRLLHLAAVVIERAVGRHFLEQLGVDAVVILIDLPLVQRQGCHGALVAHAEQDVVVDGEAVAQPHNLGRQQRRIAQLEQGVATCRMQRAEVGVQVVAAGVGIVQRLGVLTVDI